MTGSRFAATGARLAGHPAGRAAHRLFFTWFQPAVLFGMLLFCALAPDRWTTPAVTGAMGSALLLLCLGLERINPLHESWRLTWQELAVDLFYLGINATVVQLAYLQLVANRAGIAFAAPVHVASPVLMERFHAPFLVQVVLILGFIDFVHYWLHRAMHRWLPLWAIHAPHHFVTRLNALKSNVTHPFSIHLWRYSSALGGFWLALLFDFDPRAGLAAGAVSISINIYQHANIRFTPPCWWHFIFNTVEHHSLHHSRTYEAARCNYATVFILFDRLFGTFREGSEEFVGQDGGRRMSLLEQMLCPFTMLMRRRRAVAANGAAIGQGPELSKALFGKSLLACLLAALFFFAATLPFPAYHGAGRKFALVFLALYVWGRLIEARRIDRALRDRVSCR